MWPPKITNHRQKKTIVGAVQVAIAIVPPIIITIKAIATTVIMKVAIGAETEAVDKTITPIVPITREPPPIVTKASDSAA